MRILPDNDLRASAKRIRTRWIAAGAIATYVIGVSAGCGGSGPGNSSGSARGQAPLRGLAYGPFWATQQPGGSGPQPTAEQIAADMPRLGLLTQTIRTYTVAGYQSQIPTLAHGAGIATWVGGWIGPAAAANQMELAALVQAAKQPGVQGVIVGNEVLFRDDQSVESLIASINTVKRAVSVPVAYAENLAGLNRVDAERVVAAVDVLFVNLYAYWDQVSADAGPAYVLQQYRNVQKRFPGKRIIIGETGWPSAGSAQGSAIAGPQQQATFISSFLSLMNQPANHDVEYFLFEAFDETYKSESNVGPHWGIYERDGRMKPALQTLFKAIPADPSRQAAAGVVLNGAQLSPGFDMEVNTSGGLTSWLQASPDSLDMNYPAEQQWGSVSVVVGNAAAPANARQTLDFSAFNTLLVDLKGRSGGESLSVGIKTDTDPDNGLEPKYPIVGITNQWNTYRVPLGSLQASGYTYPRLRRLFVVPEFVFTGSAAQDVAFRNIRLVAIPEQPTDTSPPDGSVYVGATLSPGYGEGANSSGGLTDWVADHGGYMECTYPAGQQWGAVFLTKGDPTPPGPQRQTQDVSMYRYLVLELRGSAGGEQVDIGVKTATDPDTGQEPKFHVSSLTTSWKTVRVPLAGLADPPPYPYSRLQELYILCELVFEPPANAETVDFRNVRFEP